MGIRKSMGKNKKSNAATARNTVGREGARRQSERARGKEEKRPGVR